MRAERVTAERVGDEHHRRQLSSPSLPVAPDMSPLA